MSDKLDCLIGTYIENGTYMLTSILGQGSYGTTFAATNTELNAKVVVKFQRESNINEEEHKMLSRINRYINLLKPKHSYLFPQIYSKGQL